MTKILLVEDDNNLREIYAERLSAEGYDIASAHDGEEALAVAVKEKPDIIISDVMMPKISGFDMLDILRSTPEIKDTKVIMMTALSQADDKARADKLGADKYLVKSQVTLEDVARVVKEMINQEDGEASAITQEILQPAAPTPAPAPEPTAVTQPVTPVATPAPAPSVQSTPDTPSVDPMPTPLTPSFVDMGVVSQAPIAQPSDQPTQTQPAAPAPEPTAVTQPVTPVATPAPAPSVQSTPDTPSVDPMPTTTQQSTADEEDVIKQQLTAFEQAEVTAPAVEVTESSSIKQTKEVVSTPEITSPAPTPTPEPLPEPVSSIMTSPPKPVDSMDHEKTLLTPSQEQKPDIHQLYEQEMAQEAAATQTPGLEISLPTPEAAPQATAELSSTPEPTAVTPIEVSPAPSEKPSGVDPASIAL